MTKYRVILGEWDRFSRKRTETILIETENKLEAYEVEDDFRFKYCKDRTIMDTYTVEYEG